MKRFIIMLFAVMINLNAMLAIEDGVVEVPAKIAISVNGLGGPRCIVEAQSNWTIRQVTQAACHKLGVPWIKGNLLLGTDRLEQQTVLGTLAPEGTHTLTLTLLLASEPTEEEIKERIMDNLELLARNFAVQGFDLKIKVLDYPFDISVHVAQGRKGFNVGQIKYLKVTCERHHYMFELSICALTATQKVQAMPAIIDLFEALHRIQSGRIHAREAEALQAEMEPLVKYYRYQVTPDFGVEFCRNGEVLLVDTKFLGDYYGIYMTTFVAQHPAHLAHRDKLKPFLIRALQLIAQIMGPQIAE